MMYLPFYGIAPRITENEGTRAEFQEVFHDTQSQAALIEEDDLDPVFQFPCCNQIFTKPQFYFLFSVFICLGIVLLAQIGQLLQYITVMV